MNSLVSAIEKQDNRTAVKVEGGSSVICDIVILAVGVTPENTLAKNAGLELGVKGAVCTDEHMETSVKRYICGRRCGPGKEFRVRRRYSNSSRRSGK